MRQKFSLTSAEAHAMVTAAKLEAVKNNWKVTIAVVDEGGYLLHLERMDGAVFTSPEIATLKARTAALSRVPTKFLEDVTKERAATLMFPGRLPVQGGLPILYQGECVGAVGVSGVKSPRRRADRERRTGCLLRSKSSTSSPARSAAEYLWPASPWAWSANRRECPSVPDRRLLCRCTRALPRRRANIADQPLRVEPDGCDASAAAPPCPA